MAKETQTAQEAEEAIVSRLEELMRRAETIIHQELRLAGISNPSYEQVRLLLIKAMTARQEKIAKAQRLVKSL